MAERTAAGQREFDFNRAAFAAALTEKIGRTRYPIRKVLLAWFDARSGHVDVHPSVSEIARAGCVSAQTVRRALAELETLQRPGITIRRQQRPDGSWLPVAITILPELFEAREGGTSTETGGYLHGGGRVPPWRYLHGGTSTPRIKKPSSIFEDGNKTHGDGYVLSKEEGPREKRQCWGFDHLLTRSQLLDAPTRRKLFRYAVARGKRADTETVEIAFHAECLLCVEVGRDGGGRLLTARVLEGKATHPPGEEHYERARREFAALRRTAPTILAAADVAAARLSKLQEATCGASREEMGQALARRIAERRREGLTHVQPAGGG